ncbi:MAG: esterase [Acidimicrobiia bacterium]|nr:MAG: esterase [Acidimicrobiia bacterium]
MRTVDASWWFLAVASWGAAWTLVGLRPPQRPPFLLGISFFTAWLTTELAVIHLAWQVAATVLFVRAGALEAWPGWLALGICIASWAGLVAVVRGARATDRAFAAALDEALGDGWAAAVDARLAPPVRRFEWHRVLLPLWMRRRGVQRVRNLTYVEGSRSRRHRLDVYRHPAAPPGAPVMLQIHGGAWVIGNKDQQALPLVNHLASRGWVVVAVNYRLSPRATWPDHLVDCKRALAWIRAHVAEYGGDPGWVAVTGGSAGGHLATLMGLTANDPRFQPGFEHVDTTVRAIVPFYAVFDWTNRAGIRGPRDPMRRFLERYVVKRRYEDAPEVFAAASPVHRVHRDAPPALVVHGSADVLAPIAEARAFVRALRAVAARPVVYVELSGAQHAFEIFNSIRTLHTIAGVDRFLTWVLTVDPPRALAAPAAAGAAGAADPPAAGRPPAPAPSAP